MDKYIYDENNGFWYEMQGDYYIPCLTIPKEEQQPIGVWGQRMNAVWEAATEIVNNDLIYA